MIFRFIAAVIASVPLWTAAQPAWKLEKNVEIIVPAAPGAAFDTTGRTIQRILQDQKMLPVSSSVINKAGGGGTIAMSYLNQRPGDGHYLFVMTASVLTNNLLGVSKDTYTDFTPLAMLFSEYLAYGVRPDSPIKSARDLAEALRKDPAAYSIAVATSRGGALHIATGLALKAGYDWFYPYYRDLALVLLVGRAAADRVLVEVEGQAEEAALERRRRSTAHPREPVAARRRCARGGRTWRSVRRPLHPSHGRRRRSVGEQ